MLSGAVLQLSDFSCDSIMKMQSVMRSI